MKEEIINKNNVAMIYIKADYGVIQSDKTRLLHCVRNDEMRTAMAFSAAQSTMAARFISYSTCALMHSDIEALALNSIGQSFLLG